MQSEAARRIETIAVTLASASLAGALAFAFYTLSASLLDYVSGKVIPPALAAITFAAVRQLLRMIDGKQNARSAQFDLLTLPMQQLPDELLLTDVAPAASKQDDALILDDILAELGPESRVVRLFDRAAMPTPAQLKSRIDAHLRGTSPAPVPDASQALHEALAELRRSMG